MGKNTSYYHTRPPLETLDRFVIKHKQSNYLIMLRCMYVIIAQRAVRVLSLTPEKNNVKLLYFTLSISVNINVILLDISYIIMSFIRIPNCFHIYKREVANRCCTSPNLIYYY